MWHHKLKQKLKVRLQHCYLGLMRTWNSESQKQSYKRNFVVSFMWLSTKAHSRICWTYNPCVSFCHMIELKNHGATLATPGIVRYERWNAHLIIHESNCVITNTFTKRKWFNKHSVTISIESMWIRSNICLGDLRELNNCDNDVFLNHVNGCYMWRFLAQFYCVLSVERSAGNSSANAKIGLMTK